MKRDHRPYYVKSCDLAIQRWYVRRYLRPQFAYLGDGFTFMKPWYVEVFMGPISLGPCANVIAAPDYRVRLTVWPEEEGSGEIAIGSHALICPGVRISSARSITIGDNCMLAAQTYITDSDWHGIYDRISSAGHSSPVRIGDNVWLGDGSIVCKGVSIGENSVIGAGSVVVRDVPANVIAAGNPARVVKELDPGRNLVTREHWFADPASLKREIDGIDRDRLGGNTLLHWFRTLLLPRKGD